MKKHYVYDLNVLVTDCSITPPNVALIDGLKSVRVTKLALVDQSGTALRLVLMARDDDPNSNATSFFSRGMIGRESPIRTFRITWAEIEFTFFGNPSTKASVEKLLLSANGHANIEQLSPLLKRRLEDYLTAWNIIPYKDAVEQDNRLQLLTELLEEPRLSRVRYMLSPAERESTAKLLADNLLKVAPAIKIKGYVCPQCLVGTISLEDMTCIECGPMKIGATEFGALTPNIESITKTIAHSLRLDNPPCPVVDNYVWLLGTYQNAGILRKFLFARQLHKTSVWQKLFESWQTCIGDAEAIFITTSNTEPLQRKLHKPYQNPSFLHSRTALKL